MTVISLKDAHKKYPLGQLFSIKLIKPLLDKIKQLLRKSIQFNIGSGEDKQVVHSVDFIGRGCIGSN